MERRRKKVGMKDSNNESISKPLLITQPFSISLFNKLLFQLGSWKCSCFLLHLLQHQHRRKNQAIKICSIRKICEEKYTYKTKVSEGTFLAGVDSNGLHEISPWGEYTVHTFRGLRATAQISETCFYLEHDCYVSNVVGLGPPPTACTFPFRALERYFTVVFTC